MSDVSNLSGAELDAAVAKLEGHSHIDIRNGTCYSSTSEGGWQFAPSSDWRDGGPIIDREQISLLKPGYGGEPEWTAGVNVIHSYDGWEAEFEATGPTPLIAAMRAFVASKGAAS